MSRGFYSVQNLQHTPVISSDSNKIENVFMLDHKRNEMLMDKAGLQIHLKSCNPCSDHSPASLWFIVSQKPFAQVYMYM